MSRLTEISVVIPVYNSLETLEELFSRLKKTLSDLNKKFEIIFVNDGSRDNSGETLNRLQENHPDEITIIHLAKNFGQHNATLCGMLHSQGDVVITLDDDLQHPPEEIPKLINAYLNGFPDLVYGIPENKKHSLLRNLASFLIRKYGKHIGNTTGTGSSFRLLSKPLVKELIANHHQHFIFIDEVVHWYTANIINIQVGHHERKKGKSGYSGLRLMGMFFNLIINYTSLPLKAMTYAGFLCALLSFFAGLYFILIRIFYDVPVAGFTALIVTMFFSTGLILLCLGIIGRYFGKMYETLNRKPGFFIKEIKRCK